MSTSTAPTFDPDRPDGSRPRRVQPHRCCGIELRRMLRNRRTVIFTLVCRRPALPDHRHRHGYGNDDLGRGNVSAYIMISMAAVRRRPRLDQRRRDGRHGARPGLVAPAATHAAAARSPTSSIKAIVALVLGLCGRSP